MRFLTVRDMRSKSASIWSNLPKEQEMVITNNGKPVAILTSVSDSTLEDNLSAIRQAKASFAVNRLQMGSMAEGMDKLSDAEIQAEIAAVRKSRRK